MIDTDIEQTEDEASGGEKNPILNLLDLKQQAVLALANCAVTCLEGIAGREHSEFAMRYHCLYAIIQFGSGFCFS